MEGGEGRFFFLCFNWNNNGVIDLFYFLKKKVNKEKEWFEIEILRVCRRKYRETSGRISRSRKGNSKYCQLSYTSSAIYKYIYYFLFLLYIIS